MSGNNNLMLDLLNLRSLYIKISEIFSRWIGMIKGVSHVNSVAAPFSNIKNAPELHMVQEHV